MKVSLAEHENEELRRRLMLDDGRIEQLEITVEEICSDLEERKCHAERAHEDLLIKERELEGLKVFIVSTLHDQSDQAF